jgi:hypothetical protein
MTSKTATGIYILAVASAMLAFATPQAHEGVTIEAELNVANLSVEESIRSINALFPKMSEYPQVIKQPSACASTRCWPKLWPRAGRNAVLQGDLVESVFACHEG